MQAFAGDVFLRNLALERDAEPSNEAACDALLGQSIEVGVAEILVPDITRQHAIRADDDLVRNGDPCSTGPTARSQSMVLVL
jgi:hypothetical protein